MEVILIFESKDLFKKNTTCIPGKPVPYPPPPDPSFLENFTFVGETSYPQWEVAVKATFYTIAMFLAIVGNTLVLLAIAFNKKLQTTTNSYIAQLALSDLMVGSFNMWLHLVPNCLMSWPLGATICEISLMFRILAVTASVLFLTVIAMERFFSIVFPLKARFTAVYVHVIVTMVTWGLAIAVTIPTLGTRKMHHIIWKNFDQYFCAEVWPRVIKGPDPVKPTRCEYKYPSRQMYYTVQVVVMYIIPVLVMTVTYFVIGWTLSKRRVPGNPSNVTLAMQRRMKKKVFRMLVVVFVVFVVCYTPQQSIILYKEWWHYSVPRWISYTCIYLAYFNSALNPILYGGLNENFRRGIQEVIKCKALKKNSVRCYSNCDGAMVAPKRSDTTGSTGTTSRKATSHETCLAGETSTVYPNQEGQAPGLGVMTQGLGVMTPIQENCSDKAAAGGQWSNTYELFQTDVKS